MMTDLFEKSIATLELPRVLEQLAACASTQEGKERCLALRPMTDPDDVQRAQEETSAAVEMLIKRGSPGFSGVKPVGASLHRADMGGSLNTRELLEVAAVLRCARTVQDYGAGEEKTPISHLFRALTPNRFLEETGRTSWPTPPAASWPPSAATSGPRRPRSGIFCRGSSPPTSPSTSRSPSSPSAPTAMWCR